MEAFERTCQLVEEGIRDGAYPSACLSIGIGGHIYAYRAFGAATTDTQYDIASMSKIVSTTMIAFHMLEEGRIRLCDTLGYFFADAPDDKKDITLLQLMTHTSGIPAHFFLSDETSDPADAARVILAHPLEQAPGVGPIYTCMGYILLGRILEKLAGASIDVLAQKYVFDPLGMTHTGYRPTGDIAPTERDSATGELLCGVVHDENARFLGGLSGNAGVFSTLGDVTRFAQMLALGGVTPEGARFLSPAMLRAAIVNHTPHADTYRGLGFHLAGSPANYMGDLIGRRSFGHTGFTGTSLAVDPDTGLFVVLLTNRVCPTRANVKLTRIRYLVHNAAAAEASCLPVENK